MQLTPTLHNTITQSCIWFPHLFLYHLANSALLHTWLKGADVERRAAVKEQQRLWQWCCPTVTHPRVWGRKPFFPCLFLGSHLDRAVVRVTLGIPVLSPALNHRCMSKDQFGDEEEDRHVERLLCLERGVRNEQ